MPPHQWFGECVLPAIEQGHLSGKRLEGVLKVWAALTKMDEEPDLPRVMFFGPQLGTLGLSMPQRVFDAPIIYLNPVLEMETLGVVGHVVAHEIAHHTHGHLRLGEKNWMERREAEADVTAAVWGFADKSQPQFLFKTVATYMKKKGSRARRWIAQALGMK
jgi:hypothetical protein